MKKHLSLFLFASACFFNAVAGQSPVDSVAENAKAMKLDSLIRALDYKTGQIVLKDKLATINVPEGFAYLGSKDAQFVLCDLWGNPKDESTLGMLVPKAMSVVDRDSWAIIYKYEEEGHVKDDDAESIKYDELLLQMQKETTAGSGERIRNGYQPIELVGWAQAPFYDKKSHKLHWAKELKFGTDSINTLNYNIRMLGRKGVLVMNIVSSMDNMKTVKENIDKILASTNFNESNRYENFDSGSDKVAEYGIGGLIAGGILLKTGILAKLGFLLLKTWKFIAIGAAGLVAFLKKKFWSGGSSQNN
jgi:uncharacterized membrane-anchored protein